MLLRSLEIGLVLLLVAAGVTVLLHGQDVYSIIVVPALVFLRGFLWRLGLRRGLVFLVLPFIPFALRHRGRRNLSKFGAHCHAVGRLLRRRWHRLPRRPRLLCALAAMPLFLIGGLAALCAGGTLGFLAFLLPLRLGASTAVGGWLQTRGLPFLARTAAAQSLHGLFAPVLGEVMPDPARMWIRCRYRRLWWATMRRLVKNRQALGRRTAALISQRRGPAGGRLPSATAAPRI